MRAELRATKFDYFNIPLVGETEPFFKISANYHPLTPLSQAGLKGEMCFLQQESGCARGRAPSPSQRRMRSDTQRDRKLGHMLTLKEGAFPKPRADFLGGGAEVFQALWGLHGQRETQTGWLWPCDSAQVLSHRWGPWRLFTVAAHRPSNPPAFSQHQMPLEAW